MSEKEKKIVVLSRDVPGSMVPSGARIMLHQGTEVTITQELGDTYTINVYGNLVRIESQDGDALGREPKDPLKDLPEGISIEEKIHLLLKTVFDPEIPVNVVDLGLIYSCECIQQEDGTYHAKITMTLTAPGCGMGPVIAGDVKAKALILDEVSEADVEIVFDPPWDRSMISDEAKLQLGMLD